MATIPQKELRNQVGEVLRRATANVHGVPLLTRDAADLAILDDLVEVRGL